MKAYIFTPGDSICRKGEVAREMFIIADGILEVLSETGRVLTTMKAGDFFGEIGILNLDGLNKYGLGSLSIKQQNKINNYYFQFILQTNSRCSIRWLLRTIFTIT